MKQNSQSSIVNRQLVIGWLYPELMNIYGDRGNITTLVKRCQWRGIKTKVIELNPEFDEKQLETCNLLIMGGAQDRQQTIVNKDLIRIKPTLSEMIENGTPGLYVCGGFQFLGNYYREADGTIIDGLEIFDLHTENPGEDKQRLIGNIAIQPLFDILRVNESESRNKFSTSSNNKPSVIVGFENHGGRTYLGKNIKPFGKVIKGHGNNDDGFEGAIYKNSIGTYMHGPILPKNPELADYLIIKAISIDTLMELDDRLEVQTKNSIINKI